MLPKSPRTTPKGRPGPPQDRPQTLPRAPKITPTPTPNRPKTALRKDHLFALPFDPFLAATWPHLGSQNATKVQPTRHQNARQKSKSKQYLFKSLLGSFLVDLGSFGQPSWQQKSSKNIGKRRLPWKPVRARNGKRVTLVGLLFVSVASLSCSLSYLVDFAALCLSLRLCVALTSLCNS